ncbi:MAG: HEAT repeat domain-containing protein [Anaerolineae bacterium]|nr:HEAT repeat domain-containing protein [Anaerolineae bacterium]MDK1080962.1 HEAT repeat domain-containing protein [Anaerolineae bacterium]
MRISIQPISFFIGFLAATIFWWLMGRIKPLWGEIKENWQNSRDEAKTRRSLGVEENHRRTTYRQAQGMHLAAALFSLDEIIEIPKLLAPPARVEPGVIPNTEDIVTMTIPYMPSLPELEAYYQAPTLTLEQVLSSGMNLVITGQPGSGKTVSLAYLASLAANHDPILGLFSDKVPFFIHIADLHLPDGDIKDVLNPILNAASEGAPIFDLGRLPKFIDHTFTISRALLFLDGYDELPPEEQTKVTEYLKELLKAYPGNQVITTGAYDQLGDLIKLGFEPLALAPWNASQCDNFIARWGHLWSHTIGNESWSHEDQDGQENIDPLLINTWLNINNQTLSPLEITLKLWAGYAGDSLGPGVLDAIATHIRRLAPKGIPLAALETLGMQVALSTQPIFDSRSARDWVKNFELPEEELSEEENELAAERFEQDPDQDQTSSDNDQGSDAEDQSQSKTATPSSGLLNKMTDSGLLVSHPDHQMRFLHPVLGSYLAGNAIASVNAESSLLEQPDWTGKWLTMRYVAAHGDATMLADSLLTQSTLPLHIDLFRVSRWLRDSPQEAPWRGKVLSQLANLIQTEGIPLTLRAQAVSAFYWSGDPGAGPLFRQFLQTQSFELIQLAALGCGAIQDSQAEDLLVSILSGPSPSAKRACTLALVAIGTQTAMDSVAQALLSGDEDLKRAAAEAIANDPKEGHAMLKEGVTLEDIMLRHAVVYGLARVKEDWALEALQSVQLDDDEWVVRNSASEVLESRNDISQLLPKPLPPPSETPWLIAYAGKQGLGISPGSPATDVLIAALKSEVEDERLAALSYLKRMPSESVIAGLYEVMYADDPEMRESIFRVLSEFASAGIKLPVPESLAVV